MNKCISSYMHGLVDYGTAAALFLLSRRRTSRQRRNGMGLSGMLGCSVLGQSLLTDYELGAVRVLPFKRHLQADYLIGGLMLGAPLISRKVREETGLGLAVLGALGLAATIFSEEQAYQRDVRLFEPTEGERVGREMVGQDIREVTTPERA